MKILSENSIMLCKENSCCPIISLEGEFIKITDDFNGSIKISISQARMIKKALKLLKTKKNNGK